MAVPRPSGSDPVSVAITWYVKPGQVEEFEAWLDEIKAVAMGFDGYAGMETWYGQPMLTTRPISSFSALTVTSITRPGANHRKEPKPVDQSFAMTTGDPSFEEAHGLEGWFTLSAKAASVERPPRYKMAILTIVGLYPPIVVVGALVTATTGVSVALGTLIAVTIVAVVATYWVTAARQAWTTSQTAT